MGVIDRLIRRLPSYPYPPKLKEVRFCHKSQVFQFTSFPIGLATSPQVFTMFEKEVKLMALTRGIRLGRLAYQGPVSGRSTSVHSDSGRPDTVLRVDNKLGEVRTKTCSSVFICGLQIPSRFSPCKTHSREMA